MKNKFLLGLLALLGFSGCEFLTGEGDDDGDGGGMLMYAPLRSSFVVKGAVTDADDKPLENIRVVLKVKDERSLTQESLRDTVFTDEKGEFRTHPRPDDNYGWWTLTATDIDGPENRGEFRTEGKTFPVSGAVEEMDFTLTEKGEEGDESR